MQFASIVGQYKLKEKLVSIADNDKVGHAILFSESEGYGALSIAIAYVQYLMCQAKVGGDSCGSCAACNKISKLIHPDLHFAVPVNSTKTQPPPVSDHFITEWREQVIANSYFSEQEWYDKIKMGNKSGLINVHEAAQITRKLNLRAFEGGKKFIIMWLPEKMNQEAANKLLKLIEEPPPETYVFMVSQSPENIIPTIISRCQLFKLAPIEREALAVELEQEFDLDREEAFFWARISGGSLSKARALITEEEKSSNFKDSVDELLESCANKDLLRIISFWEEISQMGREGQRRFCEYLLEFIRRSLITSQGVEEISNTPYSQKELISSWSKRINPEFYTRAYDEVNRALEDIDKNVNSRYIFADLSNRFFLYL